jgi:predicted transcriptional regulator
MNDISIKINTELLEFALKGREIPKPEIPKPEIPKHAKWKQISDHEIIILRYLNTVQEAYQKTIQTDTSLDQPVICKYTNILKKRGFLKCRLDKTHQGRPRVFYSLSKSLEDINDILAFEYKNKINKIKKMLLEK